MKAKYIYLLFIFIAINTKLWAINTNKSVEDLQKEFAKLDSLYDLHEENNPQEALNIALSQEEIANTLSIDTLQLLAISHKASTLGMMGFMDISLKEMYIGLKKAEKMAHSLYIQKYLKSIGVLYQSMADYKQSNDYFLKAKAYAVQNKAYSDTILINYEIGFNYIAIENTKIGLKILEDNLAVAKKTNDLKAITLGLDNLSNASAELGMLEKALTYELELLNYKEGWKTNYFKTGIYEHFAEIYILLEQWENGQKYVDSVFKYAQMIHSNDWLFEYYKLQAKIDEAKGNYKRALANHKRYLSIKDSVYQEKYDVKMAAMSSLYDLENKQNQIHLLEKENDLKKSQLGGILLGSLLFIGIIIVFFILKHQKEKQKLQALFSQQLIETQENEKQRISRELHDSVGQNILFIKNQLSKTNANNNVSAILETVNQTIAEVRNISKDLYPNQLEKYGLAAAIENLGEKVTESCGIFISADFQDTEQYLSKDAMIHLYRIIQEAINNAVKHAAATALRITAEKKDHKLHFLIQDNGKGFDKSILAKKQQSSFGLLSMEERVKILGGKLEIETGLNHGTKLQFTLNNEH